MPLPACTIGNTFSVGSVRKSMNTVRSLFDAPERKPTDGIEALIVSRLFNCRSASDWPLTAVIAIGMGAQGTILDINMQRLTYLDDIFKNSINTLYSTPANIEKAVKEADLVVGTVLIAGAKAPKLVTREFNFWRQ